MDYDDDYATCAETYATLRILSHTVPAELIAQAMQVAPTRSFAKGDHFGVDGGNIRQQTGWFWSTHEMSTSRDTRRHLDLVIQMLETKTKVILDLQAMGCKIDIVNYWVSKDGEGGPLIEPYQMRRLAELDLPVWWDVYVDGSHLSQGEAKH